MRPDNMKKLILSVVAISAVVISYAVYICVGDPSVDGMLLSAVIGSIGALAGINVIEAWKNNRGSS